MSSQADNPFRVLRIKKDDDLKTIYAKVKKSFTAAALQRYTDLKPGVPGEQLLAELEAINAEVTRKRAKRKRKS